MPKFYHNPDKKLVCTILDGVIIDGPNFMEYPRSGYFLPVRYDVPDKGDVLQKYVPSTPVITEDEVVFGMTVEQATEEECLEDYKNLAIDSLNGNREYFTYKNIYYDGIESPIIFNSDVLSEYVLRLESLEFTTDSEQIIYVENDIRVVPAEVFINIVRTLLFREQAGFSAQREKEKLITLATSISEVDSLLNNWDL